MGSGPSKELRPKVGVATIIKSGNTILLGKRLTKHAHGYFAPPGGHLEFGESFETCSMRETEEETGLVIVNPKQLAVYNTIYFNEEKHYVVVFMLVEFPRGQEPRAMEPDKCASWDFFDLDQLPTPLMPGFQMLIEDKLI